MSNMRWFRACLVGLICLVACLGVAAVARADLPASESSLDPAGWAFEINPDNLGWLWVTDSTAGQVWGVEAKTGFYEVYPVGGAPTDARHQGDSLWWADVQTNTLGLASTLDGAFTHWRIPGATGFYGTAIDEFGRFWAASISDSTLYRLDADPAELCQFTLPQEGIVSYIAGDGGDLWMGDYVNQSLLRLQVSNNHLATWSLPADSSPLGMVPDHQGNIWYADENLNLLAQFNPSSDLLKSYPIPVSSSPVMPSMWGSQVWYGGQEMVGVGANLGSLDPLLAAPITYTLEVTSTPITPSCSPMSASDTGYLTITTGDLAWESLSFPALWDAGGWRLFQLPENASLWGMAALGGDFYAIDQGRQRLIRIAAAPTARLNVIKHVINDHGGTAEADDFTIILDDPWATPNSFPGAETPGTEVILNPGPYAVTELRPFGYSASYSTDCTGTISAGETRTCTITNDDLASATVNTFLPIISK